MTIAFIFPHPGMEQYLRETSVAEGESATPLTTEELEAIRARQKEHITFDRP